jgi:hypothetical protein
MLLLPVYLLLGDIFYESFGSTAELTAFFSEFLAHRLRDSS